MTQPNPPRCSCERGCNSPCNDVKDCAMHGSAVNTSNDVPVQPSTLINLRRADRRIE